MDISSRLYIICKRCKKSIFDIPRCPVEHLVKQELSFFESLAAFLRARILIALVSTGMCQETIKASQLRFARLLILYCLCSTCSI